MVCWPTVVQLLPSDETAAVNTWPARVSRTHVGAEPEASVEVVSAPEKVRRWNVSPLPGDTNIDAFADCGSRVWRIITPALVHAFTFCTLATRATIEPSPVNGTYA